MGGTGVDVGGTGVDVGGRGTEVAVGSAGIGVEVGPAVGIAGTGVDVVGGVGVGVPGGSWLGGSLIAVGDGATETTVAVGSVVASASATAPGWTGLAPPHEVTAIAIAASPNISRAKRLEYVSMTM